jgi:hypothetical protein
MTKDEALKLALEALEEAHYKIAHKQDVVKREQAITAIKEALANEALDKMAENARELGLDYEPAQEPVAWAKFSAKGNIIDLLSEPDDDYTPLYTTSPQRKPLTDEEIWEALGGIDCTRPMLIARAIEAAHGIKG